MNKTLILLVLLLMLAPNALAARQTIVSAANEFRIDLVRFDPTPVYPGQGTDVWFEITNLQTQPITDFTITIVDIFPFTTEMPALWFERLEPGTSIPFKFRLNTNKDIAEGTYKIGIQFYSAVALGYNSEPFTVTVERPTQSITATSVRVTPERVEPGKEATITITLHNALNSAINDVTVKLGLNATGIPFAPLGATSEQQIKTIPPGAERATTFPIIVLPSATPNVYKVPLVITYFDEFGKELTKQDTIGIVVDAPVTYQLDLEETSIHTKNSAGTVTISISNRGNAPIKYLSIRILDDKNYDLLSKSRVYIGNLDPDDFQTAEFTIYAKDKGNIKFMTDYKDSYNKDYQDIHDVYLPLYSTSAASRYGLVTGNGIINNLIMLVLIILAITLVIQWIKTKSLKKALSHTVYSTVHTILELPHTLHPKNLKRSYHTFKEKINKDD